MNVFGRRILSTPRVLARFSSTNTVVPPHPPASSTPTFATETAVSDYPQAPNHPGLWSESQRPRPTPATGPRFEQTAMHLQPQPLSAMDMIAKEPIRLSNTRIAACDGGAYQTETLFSSHTPRHRTAPQSPKPPHSFSAHIRTNKIILTSLFLYLDRRRTTRSPQNLHQPRALTLPTVLLRIFSHSDFFPVLKRTGQAGRSLLHVSHVQFFISPSSPAFI